MTAGSRPVWVVALFMGVAACSPALQSAFGPGGPETPIAPTPTAGTPSPTGGPPPTPSGRMGPTPPGPDIRISSDHAADGYRRHDGRMDDTMASCTRGRREQNEPTVAINPRNTDVVTAGANDYCAAIVNGDTWAGYYRSTDGGRTWAQSLVPGYPDDTTAAGRRSPAHDLCTGAADPSQAFDLEGRLYYGFICFRRAAESFEDEEGSIVVATYEGDGARYRGTALVVQGDARAFHDKVNLTVDQTGGPHSGNVYAAWVELRDEEGSSEDRGSIMVARSQDRGRTFSEPLTVSRLRLATYPDLGVGPGGTLHLVYRQETSLWAVMSEDGGRTFQGPRFVTSLSPWDSYQYSDEFVDECGDGPFGCRSGFTFSRFHSLASVAADESGVHVVWNERQGQGRSVLRVRSSPGGLAFSSPTRSVDATLSGHQWYPDIAAADGVLTVVFYDSRADPAFDADIPPGNTSIGMNSGNVVHVFAATSEDGGASWLTRRLTSDGSNFGLEAPLGQVPFWGDYIYVSAVPGATHAAWTDSRDIVPGVDPLEPDPRGDRDGFDVLDPCTYVPADMDADFYEQPSLDDPCLSQGGYDQNIYGARL